MIEECDPLLVLALSATQKQLLRQADAAYLDLTLTYLLGNDHNLILRLARGREGHAYCHLGGRGLRNYEHVLEAAALADEETYLLLVDVRLFGLKLNVEHTQSKVPSCSRS